MLDTSSSDEVTISNFSFSFTPFRSYLKDHAIGGDLSLSLSGYYHLFTQEEVEVVMVVMDTSSSEDDDDDDNDSSTSSDSSGSEEVFIINVNQ